jgi:uncharacterized protein YegJ (DUF2314 family)
MRNFLFVLLLFAVTNAFCQHTKVENNVQYKAVALPKDDARFLALKNIAQQHMPQFLDSLKKNGADRDGYSFIIKSDFVEGDKHEHMWSQVLGYGNGIFKTIFIDSPIELKNIKIGDQVDVKQTDVEDWAINNLRTKRITGDFSDKYLNTKH